MATKKTQKNKTSKSRKRTKKTEEEAKPEAKAEPVPGIKPETEKAAPKKTKKAKKVKKKKEKVIVARGKRKEAIARATIKSGSGVIRINSLRLESFPNRYVREIIREPIRYVGPEANTVNIHVNVIGGGAMGQAQAARTAIANALAEYFEALDLKNKFTSIDRSLIVEDTRRVEPKKYKGPKARARYQKSYR